MFKAIFCAAAVLTLEIFPAAAADQTWSTFNGDLMAQKYSTATEITPANVKNLKIAWQVHTGDMSTKAFGVPAETYFEATPIFVNNTVYIGTPFYRIYALAPDTGKVKWVFNPHEQLKALTQPGMKSRGVAYWQADQPVAGKPCQKIVYIGTMTAKLYAVDADSGKACSNFAKDGVLDIDQWNTAKGTWPLSILQPPTVYRNMLIIGWGGKDWAIGRHAPAGNVFGVDAQTGQLKWTFNVLPPEAVKNSGTANVWASMSVDPKTGIVYLPVSSPSPNYWGGNRKEPLPYATSITALDAMTGKVVWSRQLVHHDIWDFDNNSAPVLVDIRKDGKTIPALVQSTKQGFLFVLNRTNGEPIYPITERPIPKSDIPGEQSSPTEPFEDIPEPTVPAKWPGTFWLADLVSLGQCSRDVKRMRLEGRFTPPSLQGSIEYPGTTGGVEWGGGAVDPIRGIYVVNNSYTAQIYQLLKRTDYDAKTKGKSPDEIADYFPQTGTPYGVYIHNFFNWMGMACWAPPYGAISAYDLSTGKQLWKKPFGQLQYWGFYMPKSWGSITIGAPVITKSGLIFIGGSMDSRVRAIDMKTGNELWKAQVDAPSVAIPSVYTYKGKEYVVFSAGGNPLLTSRISDQVVAFALP
ncbi:MAG TPA: pyrroloquinoline quinone-dependent dehydrogenase [Rhizomicrobium sp.]|nr:pyrroloquinoline quinone-dependent dehydrogenase [Rhizomicrobium sp.]